MDVLIAWLWAIEYWHWWALGLALLALEAFLVSTVLVWPAAGSFIVGVVVAFLPELDWRYQVLVLALTSGASAFAWEYGVARRRSRRTDHPDLNVLTARYHGRRTVLQEPLRDGLGRIQLEDSVWQVRSETGAMLEAGIEIEIFGADGLTLLVRPVTK